jgi:hypothetical protein
MTRGLAGTLEVAGVLVIGWGLLLGLTLGATPRGIGSSLLVISYGVAVIRHDRRAVALGWGVTVLMGLARVLEGFDPVLVLVWSAFLVLSSFLYDIRERLATPTRVPPLYSDTCSVERP